jgi:hypothetical protein
MIINNFIDEWKWLTNATLESTKQLNLSRLWPRPDFLGKCGSIVVMEDDEIYLRSSPCESTSTRFICTYGNNLLFSS